MKITLVTPSFNQARHLARCLKRVLSYGHDIDHIVADGGSEQSVVELLQAHKKHAPHFRFLSEPDSGMYQALNRGFALAQTDLFGYLNCDDALVPGTITRVIEFFESHPKVQWLYGHSLEVRDTRCAFTMTPAEDKLARAFSQGTFLPQPSVFFRRSLFESTNGFDESYRLLGDHDLWLRFMALNAPRAHLDAFLGVQVMSEEQLMASRHEEAMAEKRRVFSRHGITHTSELHQRLRHRRGLLKAMAGKGPFATLNPLLFVDRKAAAKALVTSTKAATYARLSSRGQRLFL